MESSVEKVAKKECEKIITVTEIECNDRLREREKERKKIINLVPAI